jgi:hypothetical protein
MEILRSEPPNRSFHISCYSPLGQAQSDGQEGTRPQELTGEDWGKDGWAAAVRYWELDQSIPLEEIPIELRLQTNSGPFDKDGAVKQGYLFPLDADIAAAIRQEFSDQWPKGSPWESAVHGDRPIHVLLKWKASAETSTIERHKEIAQAKGSVW